MSSSRSSSGTGGRRDNAIAVGGRSGTLHISPFALQTESEKKTFVFRYNTA